MNMDSLSVAFSAVDTLVHAYLNSTIEVTAPESFMYEAILGMQNSDFDTHHTEYHIYTLFTFVVTLLLHDHVAMNTICPYKAI